MGIRDLAEKARVDPGTLSDFLNGRRWPHRPTLAKISEALGFQSDHLRAVAEGDRTEDVGDEPAADPLSEFENRLLDLLEDVRSYRRGSSAGQRLRAEQDAAGEESQDSGGIESL